MLREGEHEVRASPCPEEGAVGAARRSSLQDEIWHEAGQRQQAAEAVEPAEPAELHMRRDLQIGLFGNHPERRRAGKQHAWVDRAGSS